jgi:hypothetical protein
MARFIQYFGRNHLAIIALFFALSGGVAWGFAANTVGSRQVKNDSLKGTDVKDDSLTGKDVRESSLSGVLRCPANTIATADICYQDSDQGITYDQGNAETHCADAGMRLPTLPEALLMIEDLTPPASGEVDYWSSDENAAGGIGVYKDSTASTGTFGAPTSSTEKVRCVTAPGN